MSPFEHRTAIIFQALILTLNAFETSYGINLWIWIEESVFQTMQCQLSHQWGDAFFFHFTHVDQTLHLHLQFLMGPRGTIHVNHLQAPCGAFLRWDLSCRSLSIILIPMSILHVFGSRLSAVVGCDMVLHRNKKNLLGLMGLYLWWLFFGM